MKVLLFYSIPILFIFTVQTDTKIELPSDYRSFISEFGESIKNEDYLKAYNALRSSMELLWKSSPLILNNVQFVKSNNNSYGIYQPKDGTTYSSGENIYLYIEPVAYQMNKSGEGFYEFGFNADYTLVDADGKVLAGQEDFANLNFRSWNFNTEISLTFTYTFTGFESGKYKIITTVKDKYSARESTVEKWFTFR